MSAELRPSSYTQRLSGGAATLIILALLAFTLSRPWVQTFEDRAPEDVVVFNVTRDKPPDVRLAAPVQDIDLTIPAIRVDLPEFENVVTAQTLPSVAPISSPDASPAPSSGPSLLGRPEGTGPANGAGAGVGSGTGGGMMPPVRISGGSMPFDLKSASRAGRVTSLNFCVTEEGRASDVQLAATSGFRDMDAIAVDWLAQQRFTPGTLDGVPARMCATYDIRWSYSQATSFEARDTAKAHAETIRRRSRYPRQFVYWPEDRPFPGCDAVTICKDHLD